MLTTTTQPANPTPKAHGATCVINNENMQRYTINHVTPKTSMVINVMFHKPGTGWQ